MGGSRFLEPARAVSLKLGMKLGTFLGAGAFKETFHVTDTSGNQFALKIVDPDKLHRERLKREISANTLCRSNFVATLYQSGSIKCFDQEWFYVVEEYLDGGTLTEKLPISVEFSKNLMLCLLEAIKCLKDNNDVDDLSEEKTLLKIASFAAMSKCDGYYVVFKSDLEPRRKYSSESRLRGMLKFIKELKFLEKPITIAFSSSDMLLFKAAGATNCGTGKFFNLRRFTSSRFEEPAGGGGQLPYWFEHNLMSFLREADLKRIQNSNFSHFIGGLNSSNTWGNAILDLFTADPGKAWLALGWRQYLSWFAKTERILDSATDNKDLKDWLKNAEKNWLELNDNDVLMDEPKNDGGWLRPWRQAIAASL